ncbi:MAG: efflux RND transporter periplasmic adaptor subunit [Gammaproteobacteria bacterium]|nr:efflux RND transporter periplasmic adaptor subunit [Gammaproteobacteria bacterium]
MGTSPISSEGSERKKQTRKRHTPGTANPDVKESTPSSVEQTVDSRTMARAYFIYAPLGFVMLALSIVVLLAVFKAPPERTVTEISAPFVETMTIEKQNLTFSIASQGSVLPRTETVLVAEVSGVVNSVSEKFVTGGFFKQGEVMLTIDPVNYEVALLQAEARLEAAQARFIEEQARNKQAVKEWKLTGKSIDKAPILALRTPQLQQAKADVKAAEADLKNAKIKLEKTQIKAPYDAMVKSKKVDVGQFVATGAQMAETFAVDYAEIRLPIKSNEFSYIKTPAMNQADATGSSVILSLNEGEKTTTWQAEVSRSEGILDYNTRVNYLIVQIQDPYGFVTENVEHEKLLIGSFVNAEIESREIKDVYQLPRRLLNEKNQLFLLDQEQRLKIVDVDVIYADRQNVYIKEGLNDGDRVILTNIAIPIQNMQLAEEAEEESEKEVEELSSEDKQSDSGSDSPEARKSKGSQQ